MGLVPESAGIPRTPEASPVPTPLGWSRSVWSAGHSPALAWTLSMALPGQLWPAFGLASPSRRHDTAPIAELAKDDQNQRLSLVFRFCCALSSVEEHFLHTEGVAGSSPAARTISIIEASHYRRSLRPAPRTTSPPLSYRNCLVPCPETRARRSLSLVAVAGDVLRDTPALRLRPEQGQVGGAEGRAGQCLIELMLGALLSIGARAWG